MCRLFLLLEMSFFTGFISGLSQFDGTSRFYIAGLDIDGIVVLAVFNLLPLTARAFLCFIAVAVILIEVNIMAADFFDTVGNG